ncbi:FAD dependent oxidoreductase-domain-containing protein [Chaetomium tenue]|uniref:FAD dependent oxidoreductase-domain-containing protein n=1 Tax=Chaetomium tenue TaxID=1854479 RepID=A0ACB7PKY9_9PEZI|nr:FAD dependent oxidoreductase-domain-containing protein [Chaetomium globosum]
MTIRKAPTGTTGTITLPPAGLPSRNPSTSYWLRDPSPILLGHRGTPDFPATADVVVVGSGITGAFAARFLKEAGGGGSVVMLEAREACSGATGRNGGHCQPLVYGSVPAVAAFELKVFDFMERFAKEEDVDCDWVSLSGVHAFLSKDMFELAAADVHGLQQSHPELAAQLEVVYPSDTTSATGEKQTLASLRVPSAQGVVIQKKAASLWPYKLVAAILERLISNHPAPSFNLQTNTPVTSLSRVESGPGWTLTTPRGKITARQVLLATNGYTSHLLPAFSDLIVPTRGQIGAILPPRSELESESESESAPSSSLPAKLTHAYTFAASAGPAAAVAAPRDDYLVQRPLPSGELIYGGGRRLARGMGVGEWRDDEVEEDVARYLRRELAPPLDLTPDLGVDGQRKGVAEGELEASFEWTGVMGFSRDHHAWVGAVPESLGGGGPEGGLWICAGYTGHGMPAAALSAREVVRQMTAGSAEATVGEGEVRFPREFALDEERVVRARGLPHLTEGWEATNLAALIGDSSTHNDEKGV